ncbi:MAG: phage N-6-adenine-methyltransferase [Eubacteriales bacterium]
MIPTANGRRKEAHMRTDVMFSSQKEDWTTPQAFYDKLDEEFHFTLDAAASDENHKCGKWFTQDQDALKQDWGGETVFLNPPYGRKTGNFVKKAYEEHCKNNITVVMLLPARTDVAWFHDYILGKAEIRFIRGRLKFGGAKNNAPFPSMVAVYRRIDNHAPTAITVGERENKMEQYYIIRADKAGVFFGQIESRNGDEVAMKNVRRIWYWDGACSISELAVNGTAKPDNCKFSVIVESMTILGVCEIIKCTDKAVKSIKAVKEWKY